MSCNPSRSGWLTCSKGVRQDKEACKELAEYAKQATRTILTEVEKREHYVEDALSTALRALSGRVSLEYRPDLNLTVLHSCLTEIEDDMLKIAGLNILKRVGKRGSIHEKVARYKDRLGNIVRDFIVRLYSPRLVDFLINSQHRPPPQFVSTLSSIGYKRLKKQGIISPQTRSQVPV